MNEQQSSTTTPQISFFMTRATNVFSSPGELYAEVSAAPAQTSSWLVPFLLSLVLAFIFTFAIYNNPTLRGQIYDMQSRGMQKQVDEGKMTQERADTIREQMESTGPLMFMVFGAGFASIGIAMMFFGATLLLWIVAKFAAKFNGGYKKMLEIYGLASLISILGSLVMLIMINFFDTMYAQPSASLLVLNSFDPTNSTHRLLASINIFTLWQATTIGVGISKVSGKSFGIGIGISVGLWLLWAVASSLLGIGGMG